MLLRLSTDEALFLTTVELATWALLSLAIVAVSSGACFLVQDCPINPAIEIKAKANNIFFMFFKLKFVLTIQIN